MFAFVFKPLVYMLFLISLVPALMGRFRDIGVTPWLSAFVLTLIVADNGFLLYAGAPWSFAFSSGALSIKPPFFLAAAVALLVVLAIVPPRQDRVQLRALGWPGLVLLVVVGSASIAAGYRLIWSTPSLVGMIIPVLRVVGPLVTFGTYALIALPPAAAFALWPRAGQAVAPGPAPGPRLPLVRLALIAVGLAAGVAVLIPPNGGLGVFAVLLLPASAVRFILPNAVLFFGVLLTGYLWVTRPSWISAVLTVLLFGIYATWVLQFYLAAHSEELDARDIAAIPVTKPAAVPRAILSVRSMTASPATSCV